MKSRVTALQRRFVESRLLLLLVLVLVLAVALLQDRPVPARAAFAPVALYGLLNWKALSEIERTGPRLVDVMSRSTLGRYWLGGFLAVDAVVAFYLLMSGRDLGEHLDGFGSMFLAFLVPLAPVLCVHQKAQFDALRSAPTQ